MNRKILQLALHAFSILALLVASTALAQERRSLLVGGDGFGQDRGGVQLKGLINDYSPSTVKGGPWEMHGQWSLNLNGWGTADFSADMTMSGYGTTNNVPDPLLGGASAHTHNITLSHATITWNMTGCPTFSPATDQGFQINGTVSLLTGNGSNAPFETSPPSSTLQVCITGGDAVPYSVPFSNITLVWGGPAASHFGSQPIHGVVR